MQPEYQMGNDYTMQNRVVCTRCDHYDSAKLEEILRIHFASIGLEESFFSGKRVLIKPNLVTAHVPEDAVTTHPALVEAAARLMRSYSADAIIAESPGGPFTEGALRHNYKVTGMQKASEASGVPLSFDLSIGTFQTPNGQLSHAFDMIRPALDADIILNLCKLKTHSLAMMTAAAKNLFGTMPGLRKVELHARFSDQIAFQRALVDLTDGLCRQKEVISVCDAIVGMEGNGPSGGTPRAIGCLLSSRNPFALDCVAASILGLNEQVAMLEEARARHLLPDGKPECIGDTPPSFTDWTAPDSHMSEVLTSLPGFLKPRPVIRSSRCIGCGKCAESCPVKIITMDPQRGGKRRAHIHRKQCLHCFCCQEMCPVKAIKIRKSLILRLVR